MAGGTNLSMKITTSPGGPALLQLIGFTGTEGLSQLFSYSLEVLVNNSNDIDFGAVLGGNFTVAFTFPGPITPRFFNGICIRMARGNSDAANTFYRFDLAPKWWR